MMIRLFVMELLFCLVLAIPARHKRASVCYDPLGCFSTDSFYGFWRPINLLPASRESINTQFHLYTRNNRDTDQVISADNATTYKVSNFDPKKPTKFIVHGFRDNGFKPWMIKMKDELLIYGDLNVLAVDWGSGSKFPYTQATANTRVVGAEIAHMIRFLQARGIKAENVHIIGHSLGAHTAGYAGSAIRGLRRITGLDPARPYFQGTPRKVRLDPTDATFVDIIHTDGARYVELGFGMYQACGHVDYYPNDGKQQPGCTGLLKFLKLYGLNGVERYVECDHVRAIDYFTESINSKCSFQGFLCKNYDLYKSGLCTQVPNAKMGLHADQYKPRRRVKLFLETSDKSPFCEFAYVIEIVIRKEGRMKKVDIFLQIAGDGKKTEFVKLTQSYTPLNLGTEIPFIMKSKTLITNVSSVIFVWKHKTPRYKPWNWHIFGKHLKAFIYVDKIKVSNTEGKEFQYCGSSTTKVNTEERKQINLNAFCT